MKRPYTYTSLYIVGAIHESPVTDKSKFEVKNNQCKQGANYTLKGFEEEVFFEGDVCIFAQGNDLKMDAESRPTYQKRAKNSTQIYVFNLNTGAYSFSDFKCAECDIFCDFGQRSYIQIELQNGNQNRKKYHARAHYEHSICGVGDGINYDFR